MSRTLRELTLPDKYRRFWNPSRPETLVLISLDEMLLRFESEYIAREDDLFVYEINGNYLLIYLEQPDDDDLAILSIEFRDNDGDLIEHIPGFAVVQEYEGKLEAELVAELFEEFILEAEIEDYL